MIQRSVAGGLRLRDWWYYFEAEPAYAPLRTDARFKATLRTVRDRVNAQGKELDRMRTEDQVPDRT